MRSGSRIRVALALTIIAIGVTDLSAHRRDELLQAARIGVAADRIEIELSLTPGIAVAEDVIATIDRDGNGVLSAEEQRGYAEQVLAATELRVDGRIVKMEVGAATFPAADGLRDGDRSIELRSTIMMPDLSSGDHEIVFTNNFLGDISVYMANALKPDSERIAIASQRRDPEQRTLAIDVSIDGERFASVPALLFGLAAATWLTARRRLLPAIG